MTNDKSGIIIPTPKQVESLTGTKSTGEFMIHEGSGFEIVRVPQDLQGRNPHKLTEAEELHIRTLITEATMEGKHRVTDPTGLRAGDNILCFTVFEDWVWVTVSEIDGREGLALSDHGKMGLDLGFCNDRSCWVCYGMTNLEALKRC